MKSISLRKAIRNGLVDDIATNLEFIDENVPDLRVMIFDEDVVTDDQFDLYEMYTEEHIAGCIFKKNLTVHNSIIDYEPDTYSAFLLINGDLSCTNLVAGCTEIIVNGNVQVQDTFIGYYNHGRVEIKGNLHARVWIEDDHQTEVRGTVTAAAYSDFAEWRELLLPAVADELVKDNYLFAGNAALISRIAAGKPVFGQGAERTGITAEDFQRVVNTSLFAPGVDKLVIDVDSWYISITRGRNIFLKNKMEQQSYSLAVDEEGTYYMLYELPDREWEEIPGVESPQWERLLRYFPRALRILQAQERWNEQYKRKMAPEPLWKGIWQLIPSDDTAAFQPVATDIMNRVLYAAAYPYAYIHARYTEESARRGLAAAPEWLSAIALVDGLLQHQLIAELSVYQPLSAQLDLLNVVVAKYWNTTLNLHDDYADAPIDDDYLKLVNGQLAAFGIGVMRLDAGIDNYLLACVQLHATDALREGLQAANVQLIYPA
ncbi:DUF6630 family protein [Chitinophaga vietnamensis]|uniref:DUF6630 family protein n=1 Tax=Chitinophaga vietnamensis TaxID=2593957 RepID=UPI001177FF9C|nr:hypothetical protein [Chitinophaga vietnamensis]